MVRMGQGSERGLWEWKGSNNVPVAKRGTKRGLINGRRRRQTTPPPGQWVRCQKDLRQRRNCLSETAEEGPFAESIEGEEENGRLQTPVHYRQVPRPKFKTS